MRIPTTLFSNNLLSHIEKSAERIFWNNQRIATQKRIQRPSDDPIGTSKAIKLHKNITFNEQWIENATDALSWLNSSEIPVTNIIDLLTTASVLAVTGASETIGQDARLALGDVVNQLLEDIVSEANTQFKGKYIFGGFETRDAPYTIQNTVTDQAFSFAAAQYDTALNLSPPAHILSGTVVVEHATTGTIYTEGVDYTIDYRNGTITVLSAGSMPSFPPDNYLIDYRTQIYDVDVNPIGITGEIKRKIGDSEIITINLSGNELFNLSSGEKTFDVLMEFRDALYADDTNAIIQSMTKIESATKISRASLEIIGAKQSRINDILPQLDLRDTQLRADLSQVEDVDMAREITDYEKNQIAFQSILQMSARILQLSLLNFLR